MQKSNLSSIKPAIFSTTTTASNFVGNLTKIVLGDEVTGIDKNLFTTTYKCINLSSVSVEDPYTGKINLSNGIGRNAFPSTINSDDTLVKLGCESFGYVLYKCNNNKLGAGESITLSESDKIMSITDGAFESCSNLSAITIEPYSDSPITRIGDDTFKNCTNLVSASIVAPVEELGSCAFSGCSSLRDFTIPSNVTRIPDGCFYGCSSLDVDIGENVVAIGSKAFQNSGLTKLTLKSSLKDKTST